MGDKINKLPIDDTLECEDSDLEIIGSLFQNKEKVNKVSIEFKDPLIASILFAIISSSPFDRMIRSSGCLNEKYIWIIKLACFFILFYILKNRFM
jgi:hypothetical protein